MRLTALTTLGLLALSATPAGTQEWVTGPYLQSATPTSIWISWETRGGDTSTVEWGMVEPDWIAPSPLGNYLVVQWVRDGVEPCSGLETFDIHSGEFVGRVHTSHAHGDLGVVREPGRGRND